MWASDQEAMDTKGGKEERVCSAGPLEAGETT